MGPKFRRNRSISYRFRDKCAFAFYAEIQDVHQKLRESVFCLKSPVNSSYTLRAKIFVEIALSRTVSEISVFTFHAEIQDGCQKWQESDFCDTLGIENFDKIPLSCTVKEIEANLCFSIFGKNLKIQNGN